MTVNVEWPDSLVLDVKDGEYDSFAFERNKITPFGEAAIVVLKL